MLDRIISIEFVLWLILFFIIAIYSSGCSTLQLPELTNYSDQGVIDYSKSVMKYWNVQTDGQDVLSYGGAISLAGLSSGTVLAAAAHSPGAPGMALGSAILGWTLGVLKPTGHSNAILQGAVILLGAREKYFTDRTAAGISKTPTDCMTPYAGEFVASIDLAIGRWLTAKQELAPVDPQPPQQGKYGAREPKDNTCGR